MFCAILFLGLIILQICHIIDFHRAKHCHQAAKPNWLFSVVVFLLIFVVLGLEAEALCLRVPMKRMWLPFLAIFLIAALFGILSYSITLWSGRNIKPSHHHLVH
ncbi:MAG: hypothetical protein Q8N55_02630 [bacterium]|nr:hypothetical protein [bacterium]